MCPLPTTAGRRKLLPWFVPSFIWLGGGGCRSCFPDNDDHRSLHTAYVVGTSEWFHQDFAPQLTSTLKYAIEQEIAPDHPNCLGSNSTANVEIIEVSLEDLELHCDDGRVMDQLASINLIDVPLQDFQCGKCVSIDFSTDGGEDKKRLRKGQYVSGEWKEQHGLTITASGGFNPGQQARVLDTSNSKCITAEGSSEFGSPNRKCAHRNGDNGLGVGIGGAPGQQGENCVPVGSTSRFCMMPVHVQLTCVSHILDSPFSV